MSQSLATRPRGFVLLPVVLAITLVAAIAYLISRESAIQLDMAAGEAQVSAAQIVAEAGFEHANWQLQQANCSGYTDLTTTGFGSNNYNAAITDAAGNPLTAGSPVKISATGTLANGTSRSLARDNVKVYQAPTTVILQLDAASGKDTYLYEWKSSWNYGIALDLWVDERFADSTANGLIEFDLGSIPEQAKVISAALALYQNNPSLAGGPVDVYRMTRVWTEGTKSGGIGSPNWTESDTGVSWTNVGGDYDATLAATTAISASTLDWFNWDITKLVDGWVAGKYQNYGLALVAQSIGTAAHFHSSDYSDPTLRPKLTITYSCECGVVCGGTSGNLLMVVVDPGNLTSSEVGKKTQVESWDYTVSLIDESDSQSAFDTALAINDVVYISEDADSTEVGTKLTGATIGVVTEEDNLSDEFGLSDGIVWEIGTTLDIVDNSHYITQPFPLGPLTVLTTSQYMSDLTGSLAPDLNVLGNTATGSALAAVNAGASIIGGTAAGRRVQLPWGDTPFEINRLNTDGLTLFERALAWGAGTGGDGSSIFETQIATDDDDAEQMTSTGSMYLDSSDLELAVDSSTSDLVGMRFTGITIPQDATISNAYVQFQVDETDSGTVSLNIRGENTDNAAQFTTSAFNISSRSPTVASVPWAPPAWNTVGEAGLDQRTPDIAAVIQEIIDHPGWSSGNALVVTVTGSGTRTAESYQGDPNGAPLLHIEYSGGGVGGGGCNGNFRDQFNNQTFDGDDGGLSWSGPWLEVGESNGATSGDIQVMTDNNNYQLRTRDNDNGGEGVEREADLSGATSATLSYKFRRQSLDNSNDYTAVEVSANGASGPWTELTRHQGGGTDSNYQSANHDISAWISANTRIRFKTSSNMGGSDIVWFDDVEIQCSP